MKKMKILMVNKFHHIRGGSETYYFALKKKLREEGHTVVDFSMKDSKNIVSSYSKYFVDNVDYSDSKNLLAKIKMAVKIIYSREAKEKFEALVRDERPDMVHLHIFQHQISPSILDVCKKYDIPTVYTAHDLKMICLNYKMMHHGRICEDCKDGHLYHCLINKCVKDSYSKSSINMTEGYIHRWRKSYDAIDYIITPSDFYRKKFVEFGINSDRVVHLSNFLETDKSPVNVIDNSRKYYLYLGRISEEKGVITLVKAMKNIHSELYIVGSGPLKEEIDRYISYHKMQNIKMLGFKSGQELMDIIGNAKALILPSEWYENGPYSAIEALQLGRPVIGSDIGGIPELVDGNGYLFKSGDVVSLHETIKKFEMESDAVRSRFERRSEEIFRMNYTASKHIKNLMLIYGEAVEKHK